MTILGVSIVSVLAVGVTVECAQCSFSASFSTGSLSRLAKGSWGQASVSTTAAASAKSTSSCSSALVLCLFMALPPVAAARPPRR